MTAVLCWGSVWMALASAAPATGSMGDGGALDPLFSPYDDSAPNLLPVKKINLMPDEKLGRPFVLDIWFPAASGVFPVFFFLTGLNGMAPPPAYDGTMRRLAARGIIAVLPFVGLAGPSAFKKQAAEFEQDITWMRSGGLSSALAEKAEGAVPIADLGHLVIAGHSSGGKGIVELYRRVVDRVAGVVLLEPVEVDPANMSPPSLGDEDHFDFKTPLLVTASGLGDQPGVNLKGIWPPCAPADASGLFFYEHFASPRWYVKALDFGHADMLDGLFLGVMQTTRFCKSALLHNMDRFRSFLAGLIAAFIRGPVMGDPRLLRYLEDEHYISLDVELLHD